MRREEEARLNSAKFVGALGHDENPWRWVVSHKFSQSHGVLELKEYSVITYPSPFILQ